MNNVCFRIVGPLVLSVLALGCAVEVSGGAGEVSDAVDNVVAKSEALKVTTRAVAETQDRGADPSEAAPATPTQDDGEDFAGSTAVSGVEEK